MRKSRGRKFVSGLMHALHLGKKEGDESPPPPPAPDDVDLDDV